MTGSWVNIVLSEGIADLSPPGFSANQLLVDAVVADDVHVIPPAVEIVVVKLLVHSHVNHAVNGQVKSIRSGNHLSIVNEAEVRGGHSVVVLIVVV